LSEENTIFNSNMRVKNLLVILGNLFLRIYSRDISRSKERFFCESKWNSWFYLALWIIIISICVLLYFYLYSWIYMLWQNFLWLLSLFSIPKEKAKRQPIIRLTFIIILQLCHNFTIYYESMKRMHIDIFK